jgi:hypothetical protein
VGEQPAAFLAELAGEGVHGPGLASGRRPDQPPVSWSTTMTRYLWPRL